MVVLIRVLSPTVKLFTTRHGLLQGFKPLQVSFKCVNNAECVEMLLKQGADASAKDHAVRLAGRIPSEPDCTEAAAKFQ